MSEATVTVRIADHSPGVDSSVSAHRFEHGKQRTESDGVAFHMELSQTE